MEKILLPTLFLFLLPTPTKAEATSAKLNIAIYKNATCTGTPAGLIPIDLTKTCANYSYVDSKGVTTRGSNGHFRCYPDKIVYNKYPFAPDCDEKARIIDRDHQLGAGAATCQGAPSHEGPVYEKLIGYTYPGHENCR